MDPVQPVDEPIEEEIIVENELMLAIRTGDLVTAKKLAEVDEHLHHRDQLLRTPLHLAAQHGHLEIVNLLLSNGAVWNTTDLEGLTVGEYALNAGHQEVYNELINAGCRAELILACVEKHDQEMKEDTPINETYLTKPLKYENGNLIDAEGNGVMMGWEDPLMKIHAEIICQPKLGPVGDILNVGFGLGIIDTYIQGYQPRTHTIIEAHPDVYKHMIEQGWDKKPGVRILFGRWQDVVDQLVPCGYDGIFFDTFGEFYQQLKDFHEILGDYLKPEGIYSFFNGLGATNIFFHDVYTAIVKLELQEMGFSTVYQTIKIDPTEETWKDITRKYWTLKNYYLPTCKWES